jgi:hypothetical protein
VADGAFAAAMGARPGLCEAALRAEHCWVWCDGWAPERWPLYDALHPVPDWHLMADLLQEIKRSVRSKNHPHG